MFTTQRPQRQYVEVIEFEGLADGVVTDERDTMKQLRSHAGKFGCDGLIFVAINPVTAIRRATCIVYTDAAPGQDAAPDQDAAPAPSQDAAPLYKPRLSRSL